MAKFRPLLTALGALALGLTSAQAATGKLLLTGGVSSVDGAAGGGLGPWAVIGGPATAGELGGSAHLSRLRSQDYGLGAQGLSLGWDERLELSLARQTLDTGPTAQGLGLPGLRLKLGVLGLKWRVAGDAVLDSDRLMPQIALGLQHKQLASSPLDDTLDALGARRRGTDLYLSATKLWLAQGLLLNATLRATQANQGGLLGFGATLGGDQRRYTLQPELALAYLLNKRLAIGAEYRAMPDKLRDAGQAAGLGQGLRADDWKDVFIVWAPSKRLSLTLAHVDLGRVVPATTQDRRQRGGYLSVQLAH